MVRVLVTWIGNRDFGAAKDARGPGTPAMGAVWIILGKTRYPAKLIEASREKGVVTADVPFALSAALMAPPAPGDLAPPAAFATLVYGCAPMRRVVARAQRSAGFDEPVLIQGESGTGKELLARALHEASPRQGKPFIAANCGAIPAALAESELFGHEKGAFTGAARARTGRFVQADGGTLFLDEIGES